MYWVHTYYININVQHLTTLPYYGILDTLMQFEN